MLPLLPHTLGINLCFMQANMAGCAYAEALDTLGL